MVLAGEDEAFHAGFLGRANNLLGVKSGRKKDFLAFVAVAPFSIGEGVHGEVKEAVELHLVPAQLALRGNRSIARRRSNRCVGGKPNSTAQRQGQAQEDRPPGGSRKCVNHVCPSIKLSKSVFPISGMDADPCRLVRQVK